MWYVLIVYAQIFLGKVLNKIAKEELSLGRSYLLIAEKVLIILTAFSLVYASLELKVLIGMVIGFTVFKYIKGFYFLIGMGVFLNSSLNQLVFLTLLTLFESSLSKFKVREVVMSSVYFALPFALVTIETFINVNSSVLNVLVAGGLLAQIRARGSAW